MAATKTQQAEWQGGRVPKLSYRKAIPKDELEQMTYPAREQAPNRAAVRTTVERDPVAKSTTPPSIQTSSKKKGILSGFFSKEPTLSALAQVEADLTAKHGAATPQTVPHVSSRKMPEHVPKVNSRWDGVPETVRNRDREERQRKRLSQQNSSTIPQYYLRSQSSSDSIRDDVNIQRDDSRRGSETSNPDSWQSQYGRIANMDRPGSISSATSSENAREPRRPLAPSVKSQSLRSPSGSSLPEITSFFPHHQQPTSSRGTDRDYQGSYIASIPEHSSSPAPTPRETSPVTPISSVGRVVPPQVMVTDTSRSRVNTAISSQNNTKKISADAFLAGEARPLELQDDESSTRKVVAIAHRPAPETVQYKSAQAATKPSTPKARPEWKTTNVVRSEAAPWEVQEAAVSKRSAPAIAKNRTPKVMAMR